MYFSVLCKNRQSQDFNHKMTKYRQRALAVPVASTLQQIRTRTVTHPSAFQNYTGWLKKVSCCTVSTAYFFRATLYICSCTRLYHTVLFKLILANICASCYIVVQLFVARCLTDHISEILRRVLMRTYFQLHDRCGSRRSPDATRDREQVASDRRPLPPFVLGGWTSRREAFAAAGASRRPNKAVMTLNTAHVRRSVDADTCETGCRWRAGRLEKTSAPATAQLPIRARFATALAGKDLTKLVSDEEIDDEVDG